MEGLPVSVVVASRGRAEALSLCLTALGQLQYHPFEIVVVADPSGCDAAKRHALGDRLKIVPLDDANLARARNLGIAASGGEIVAFIDDDAFAEPGWLAHLAQAFADETVAGAGGYVVGRNGISLQWGARSVDAEGWHRDIPLSTDGLQIPDVPSDRAVRTEGTNMAFRRTALVRMGGFDEVFRYYMEETDLNVRMAQNGMPVAIVPKARVWHRQDASPHRRANRAPRSLFDIGASTAAYLIRHANSANRQSALLTHRQVERQRLVRHMVNGALLPGDVQRILSSFDEGAAEGLSRPSKMAGGLESASTFQPVYEKPNVKPTQLVSGWFWGARRLNKEAQGALSRGALVHLVRQSPTGLYHRRSFREPGIWLQTGGVFGRSDRDAPILRAIGPKRRAKTEFATGPLARPVSIER